jgi:hypothetical protein
MFLFICVAGPGQLMAQTKVVRGTVISGDDKQSLPGVNVSIKGTTTGVVTDINGQYSITVSSKDVLVSCLSVTRLLKWLSNEDLKQNLGAAARLIHGSTENRFLVT